MGVQTTGNSTRRAFFATAGSLVAGGVAYWLLRHFHTTQPALTGVAPTEAHASLPASQPKRIDDSLAARLRKRFEYRMQNPLPATVIPEYERTAEHVLVPLFPTLRRWVSQHTGTIGDYLGTSAVYDTGRRQEYARAGANAATVRHFESRYRTTPINDYFHPDQGSVHCVVNVLS